MKNNQGLSNLILSGSQLKRLRIDAGLTQRMLAQYAGVSQAHIAKIENGKVDPRLSTVNKILQILTEGEGRKCLDLMTQKVIVAAPKDTVRKMSEVMIREAISQLPVLEDGRIIGTVTEESIIRNLHINIGDETAADIMGPPLPCVLSTVNVNMIRPLLEEQPGVLLTEKGDVVGIITRSDLLKTVTRKT